MIHCFFHHAVYFCLLFVCLIKFHISASGFPRNNHPMCCHSHVSMHGNNGKQPQVHVGFHFGQSHILHISLMSFRTVTSHFMFMRQYFQIISFLLVTGRGGRIKVGYPIRVGKEIDRFGRHPLKLLRVCISRVCQCINLVDMGICFQKRSTNIRELSIVWKERVTVPIPGIRKTER